QRRRGPGHDYRGGGGAAVRRACGRGQARFRGDRRERGGRRRGRPAAGWDRAGGRAGGGAGVGDGPGPAGAPGGEGLRCARRRGAVAGQQTLRATIDWSFQLLTEPEQALLAGLAVFAGGAALEAVEAVCSGAGIDPDAVLELLAALVARSLVVAEERGLETRY